MVQEATTLLAQSERLQAIAGELAAGVESRLTLAIDDDSHLPWLGTLLEEFARRYPKVRIELTERGSTTLERLMHEGVFDLGLITTEPRFSDLVYDLLETEEVVLIAGIHQTFETLPPDRLAAAVGLICDPARRVLTLGGRFSGREVEALAGEFPLAFVVGLASVHREAS